MVNANLVERARCGDREAFGRLFEQHRPMLTAVCRRALEGRGGVDEVVQDTAVAALLGMAGFGIPSDSGAGSPESASTFVDVGCAPTTGSDPIDAPRRNLPRPVDRTYARPGHGGRGTRAREQDRQSDRGTASHAGREIGTAGDSILAVFDAPGAALRAAFEANAAVRPVLSGALDNTRRWVEGLAGSPALSVAAVPLACFASQPTVIDPCIQGWIAQR